MVDSIRVCQGEEKTFYEYLNKSKKKKKKIHNTHTRHAYKQYSIFVYRIDTRKG